jgi:hypothetical protein
VSNHQERNVIQMATRKRTAKKNNKKKRDGIRSKKSSGRKRVERLDRTATTDALVSAAEALTRAAEALLKAINIHLGDRGPARGLTRKFATAEAVKGNCLDLATAGQIVENAVNSSAFDIDKTLEQMGLISPGRRQIFRQDVLNSVRNLGCQINDTSVPNAADDTARNVRDTIVDEAFQ